MYPHIESIQGFVDGMIEQINKRPQMRDDCGLRDDLATWLRDFKTIAFKAPRQCGATFWTHSDFLKYDDAILVVPNQTVRESLRSSYNFNRRYIMTGETCDDTSLPRSVVRRIITHNELANYIGSGYDIFGSPISRVYIQNTNAFFKLVRRAKFYDWLADVINFDGFVICNEAA